MNKVELILNVYTVQEQLEKQPHDEEQFGRLMRLAGFDVPENLRQLEWLTYEDPRHWLLAAPWVMAGGWLFSTANLGWFDLAELLPTQVDKFYRTLHGLPHSENCPRSCCGPLPLRAAVAVGYRGRTDSSEFIWSIHHARALCAYVQTVRHRDGLAAFRYSLANKQRFLPNREEAIGQVVLGSMRTLMHIAVRPVHQQFSRRWLYRIVATLKAHCLWPLEKQQPK